MKSTLSRRLSGLTISLVIVGVLLLGRLASYQFQIEAATYLRNKDASSYLAIRPQIPERGKILDRNGELLASNMMEYKIAASPNYISDKVKAAHDVAAALGDDPAAVLDLLNTKDPQTGKPAQYVIVHGPVPFDVAQKVAQLNIFGILLEKSPRRIYPQNTLAGQILGFVGWNDDTRKGYSGVEGQYNNDLTGQISNITQSQIPSEYDPNIIPPPGRDIMLTIDRNIQYLAETELQDAIAKYGAISGNILIMDPRNGEILAMANYPSFDPNQYAKYAQVDPTSLVNSAVSSQYEPGSVFKIVTAAVALEYGKLTLDWTYQDNGVLPWGKFKIYNWDKGVPHGSQSFTDVLVHSWNIGTANMAMKTGPTMFYKGLKAFGVGAPTGIDLDGEALGAVHLPGTQYFSDIDLLVNSYGQGLAVTPLQMLAWVNTIANDGQMMQPHIRLKTIDGNRIIAALPAAIRTPITAEVAHTVRDLMIKVVSDPQGEGKAARVAGYNIAGKTGTAQIPCATCPDGFEPELHEVTFVGFLPADEPRVSILIKLDKVSNLFASQSTAPAFSQLTSRLVVLMNIPTDAQRQALNAGGGDTALITGK